VGLTSGPGRGWGGWTLAARLRAALAALSLGLLLAGLALVLVLRQADRAVTDQTRRTYPARVAASQLLTSLVDQETGLRGFALTDDERFLEPYRNGLVAEQQARAELERYIRPTEPVRLALASVDAAIRAWRDQYASLRIAGGETPTDSTIQFGRELFERVRETNAALDQQLGDQVEAAREQADQKRRLVLGILGVMALAVAAAVLALQRALRTAVLRPMGDLAAQVAAVAQGDHARPIRPEGPPDLRSMGAGVESMRLELVSALAEVEAQSHDLERRAMELARSNADLEQFAYVASHDLQEPLRKVASFCQLLEQRYGDQLDERATQYIAFAVDGAKRMQRLITDLLTFSRVGRTTEGFAPVDLTTAVDQAWSALDAVATEAGASIHVDVAPDAGRVSGDPSLVQALLGNLLANAIKYRRADRAPEVAVSAVREGDLVRVDVSDNGIGIPPEYAEKVFVIFQRLHARDEYEGTGIGVALAKKSVAFHGGTISVLPSTLGGARLSFTLPSEEHPLHA
jgi:signal transduction histidine kinase